MNNKESEFQQLLFDKYGEGIVKELYDKGHLLGENIKKDAAAQTMVASHISLLFANHFPGQNLEEWTGSNYKPTEDKKKWDGKSWAFDFPGWIGSLDFTRSYVKKYMVVGLEPHIERYDFQIAYGLSDNAPGDEGKRFSIDSKEKDFVRCKDDSSLIWTNLLKILGDDELIETIKNGDKNALRDFLDQFYITDLCHFAPQCEAGEIYKIKDWPGARYKVADHFLKKEIEIIKPEVVITQGTGVFFEVLKILEADSFTSYIDDLKKQRSNVKMAQIGSLKIINLPHFGSKMMANTFWKKEGKLTEIREILRKYRLIDFKE